MGVFTPGVAAHDVREDLRQARGVFEVFFRVVPVDGALCVAVPVCLSLGQVVIARLHSCQQPPLLKQREQVTHKQEDENDTKCIVSPCVHV